MKERGNYETMGKATHLYIKEIHVIEVIKHDPFNRDRDSRAHLAQSPVLIEFSCLEVLLLGCEAD
jgi:hypothetical protein